MDCLMDGVLMMMTSNGLILSHYLRGYTSVTQGETKSFSS